MATSRGLRLSGGQQWLQRTVLHHGDNDVATADEFAIDK
jgi:hypothetical protein